MPNSKWKSKKFFLKKGEDKKNEEIIYIDIDKNKKTKKTNNDEREDSGDRIIEEVAQKGINNYNEEKYMWYGGKLIRKEDIYGKNYKETEDISFEEPNEEETKDIIESGIKISSAEQNVMKKTQKYIREKYNFKDMNNVIIQISNDNNMYICDEDENIITEIPLISNFLNMYKYDNVKKQIKEMVEVHYEDYYSKFPELGSQKQIYRKLAKRMDIGPYLFFRKQDKQWNNKYKRFTQESVKRLDYTRIFLEDSKREKGESAKDYKKRLIAERIAKLNKLGIKEVRYDFYKNKDAKIGYTMKLFAESLKSRKNLNSYIIGVPFLKSNNDVKLLENSKIKSLNPSPVIEKVKEKSTMAKEIIKEKATITKEVIKEKGINAKIKLKATGEQAKKMGLLIQYRKNQLVKYLDKECEKGIKNTKNAIQGIANKVNGQANIAKVRMSLKLDKELKGLELKLKNIKEKTKYINQKTNNVLRKIELEEKNLKEKSNDKKFDMQVKLFAVDEQLIKMKKIVNERKQDLKQATPQFAKKLKRGLAITGCVGVAGLSLFALAKGNHDYNEMQSNMSTEKHMEIDNNNVEKNAKIFVGNIAINEYQEDKQSEDNQQLSKEDEREIEADNEIDANKEIEANQNVQAPEMVDFEDELIDVLEIGVGSEFSINEGNVNTQANGNGTLGDYKNTGVKDFKISKIAVIKDGNLITSFDNGESLAQIKEQYPDAELSYLVVEKDSGDIVGWNNENANDINNLLINNGIYKISDELDDTEKTMLVEGKTSGQIDKNSSTLSEIKKTVQLEKTQQDKNQTENSSEMEL